MQAEVSFPYDKVINVYIVYELDHWPLNLGKNCFFGAVKLTGDTIKNKFIFNH